MEDLRRLAKLNGIPVNGLSTSKNQHYNYNYIQSDNYLYLYTSNTNTSCNSGGCGSYQMNPTNLSLADTQKYCR